MSSHRVATRFLNSADGTRLFLLEIGEVASEKTLIIVHGYGEHGERYKERALEFADAGYRVLIADMRGHGRSDGRRGHVMKWSEYLEDVDAVFAYAESPPEQTVLLGHSNGGLITISYLIERSNKVCAAAVTSPLLGLAIKPPKWKEVAGRLLSRVAPKVSFPTEISPDMVSRNPEIVLAYATDPYVNKADNARWYTEALAAIDRAFAKGGSVGVPMFVMQGADDKLVSASASERWANERGDSVQYVLVPDAYHEVLFEVDGADHAKQVRAFLEGHLTAGGSSE